MIVTNACNRERSATSPNERLIHELHQKYRNAVIGRLSDSGGFGAVVCDFYPDCSHGNTGGPGGRFYFDREVALAGANFTAGVREREDANRTREAGD